MLLFEAKTHFLLSSRLSRGEVNSGFADSSAAMVRTAESSTSVLAMPFDHLPGSRHLKMVPKTSIFANRRSTGIMLIYGHSESALQRASEWTAHMAT